MKPTLQELFDKLPPLVLAERDAKSEMTNARRLKMIAIPLVKDLVNGDEEEPHPGKYCHLTGDDSAYNLCVATGLGNHDKGAKLHKDSQKRIRRVRENVQSMLRYVSPDDLEELMVELDLSQDEFIKVVTNLPSAVVPA